MRIARGLAALAALLLGLLGVPWLLITLTQQLQPVLAAWTDLTALLTGPDPLAIVLGLLLVVAWVAWVIFTLGAVSELVDLLSGRQIRIPLPGLAPAQRLTAGLLVSVLAMISTSPVSSAEAPTPRPAPATPAPATAEQSPADVRRATASAVPVADTRASRETDDAHVHQVEPGDDLWSLAQRFYGQGSDWRRIAAANPDRLTGGPDRLEAGWKLRIPGVERPDGTSAITTTSTKDDDTAQPGEAETRTVVVRPGETLSAIAERFYGDEARWPRLWRANQHQLDDPDELLIGMRLIVPEGKRNRSDEDKADDAKAGKAEAPPDRTDPRTAARERSGARSAPAPNRTEPTSEPTAKPTAKSPEPTPSAEPTCEAPGEGAANRQAPEAPAPEAPAPEPQEREPQPQPPDREAANQPNRAEPPPGEKLDPAAMAHLDAAQQNAVAAGLAGVGALLAASLIGGLAARRRTQLQSRPVGRRILHPSESAKAAEVVLGRRSRHLGLRTLDLATRAISASCRANQMPLPRLTVATVDDDHLDLHLAEPAAPPPGFRADGSRWVLAAADVDYLKTVPGLGEAVRPYPALVTLGLDANRRPVVGDLETLGLLRLQADDPVLVEATLTAMAVELSFSPWAEEMILTLVGAMDHLPEALGKHNVTHTDDMDALLDRLEARAAVQREQQAYESPGQHRVDPDLADPWAPEIVLINEPVRADQEARLQALLRSKPRVTMAAVLPGTATSGGEADWTMRLERDGTSRVAGILDPLGWSLTPQLIEEPAAAAVLELITITGSDVTSPAPWWADPDPPPDNVTYLGKRFGGWATQADSDEPGVGEMSWGNADGEGDLVLHPTLRLLGPIELLGAAGTVPPRAARQCLEYCGWLLEHPGATARAMAASLVVAEGTRRSNMSRLRVWLGNADDGSPFLPDAYSGRIRLHPAVSSDWQRLQIFTAGGVNLTRTSGLEAALQLVRGAPLADAAPGQWYWAEELRTDMISAVRDIGVELATRALDDNDIDLARWAAGRAMAAAPGDELLLVARIRTEHQAGNRREVERLTLQLAAQARQLSVDLAPETVTLLQEVMEGRVRARMA